MRLTLTTDDGRIAQINVENNESIENVKALIDVELQIPLMEQRILHNNQEITSITTLNQTGIKEDDLLLILRKPKESSIQRSNIARAGIPTARTAMQLQDIPPNCSPELLIEIMEKNPPLLQQIQHSNEELGIALREKNLKNVRAVLLKQQMAIASRKYEEQQALARLERDPFDVEAQAKIEEIIQRNNIEQNLMVAMDELPEAFGRVYMLYIDCEVNGVPLKAFVDSGAQSTIMSSSCAEKCNIMRLVDKRFAGQAFGVGSATIVGRIHVAQLKIGKYFYPCSFTVLDQQDVDFLFGLDMLKRHQACIDLKNNVLRLEHSAETQEVRFLAEHELPKNTRFAAENPPTPKPPAAVEAVTTKPADEEHRKLQQLVSLGFPEARARQALLSSNGDVELAAGLLFEQG